MEISVTKPFLPDFEEYTKKIFGIWEREWLTNFGALHDQLNNSLMERLRLKNLSLFTNGHLALESALEALDVTGEVITTPFTFASTTNAIIRKGLTPIFCDISADTYCIDPNKIEKLITANTTAILPVHVYGNVCDIEKIQEIAQKYHLKVIYDAAHGFGVEYNECGLGTFGDAVMFSFHATKIFHTIEGGGVSYSDNNLSENFKKIQNFGLDSSGNIDYSGGNGKMNEFQAAMGLCNLEYIDCIIEIRQKLFQEYDKILSEIQGISLPIRQKHVRHNYSYYYITIDSEIFGENRDTVYDRLHFNKIYARKYFYPLTNKVIKDLNGQNNLPIAQKISESVLVLPLYTTLTLVEISRICNIIKEGH